MILINTEQEKLLITEGFLYIFLFIIDSTKMQAKTEENAIRADPVSDDFLLRFKNEYDFLLEELGIDKDKEFQIIFGLKKWSLGRGFGHRAVIIKLLDEKKSAFRLELDIHKADADGQQYIIGKYCCPKDSCNFQDKSYTELVDHHLKEHISKGEEFPQRCCDRDFNNFTAFCKHVYENHRNSQTIVGLYFEEIRQNGYEKFLTGVQFYESYVKTMSFDNLLKVAGQIISSFGTYWIFMWNCQDFAAWYLNFMGIPLTIIEPTIPDTMTGSGTNSSARKVQSFKGWMYYKQPEQLKVNGLQEFVCEVMCMKCQFMPSMSMEVFQLHHENAHKQSVTRKDSACK